MPRVRALVAEDVAAVVVALHPRLQHALDELLGLARVEPAGRLEHAAAVLVAPVLPVEDLARDGDRGIVVEQLDLVVDDREVPVGEASPCGGS